MGLTRLAIHRPLTVLMGLLGLVLMGGVAYTYLKVDRLPPIVIGFLNVSVSWPQASPSDVELLVAEPLENAISGMEGVQQIESTSSEGSCTVSIQLVEGQNPDAAAIDLERRVSAIRGRLPSDAGDPSINKFDPNATPIMNIALTGAPLDLLYDLASNQIQPQLQSVVGVGNVNLSGGIQSEIQVKVNYAQLQAYGLNVTTIANAIGNANVTEPVGTLTESTQQLDVRAAGRFQSVDDLANLVVAQGTPTATGPGAPVLLRDVATVGPGYKQQYNLQRFNGTDAVGMSVVKTSNANAIQVADDVRAELRKMQDILPAGTTVAVVNDSSVFTRAALDSIQRDVLLAVFLVGAIVLLFLHEWKHTAIVLLAIPTCLISTFLAMYLLGFTLNIMTLMALALMIGILVDDSIVVLENIHRHLQLGESPWQAAINGRSEIGLAAIAITMADVVVYTPIAFMSGTVGQLFRQYGLTIVCATLMSLLVSFTLTPMLASRWLTHDREGTSPLHKFGRWWDHHFDRLGAFVAASVPWTIRGRWLVVLVGTALVVAAASLIPLHVLGLEYAPQEDDNNFNIMMQTPPGSSLSATDAVARQMYGVLRQIPEVQDVFTSVSIPGGGGGFFGARGGGRINMSVQLVDKSQRNRSIFDVINQVRGAARNIPGATFSAGVASPLGGPGGGGNINMDVTGPDLDTLQQVTDQITQATSGIPGLADLQNSSVSAAPELRINFDQPRMAQLGVTPQQVSTALRTTLGGSVVSEFRPEGKEQLDITLVATDADRYNINNIGSIPVATVTTTGTSGASASGSLVGGGNGPLLVTVSQVATISYGTGPVQIQRINRNRSATLSGQVSGRPLNDVVSDVNNAIKSRVSFPPGYTYTLRGQVQQFNTALAALGAALVLSVVLEYMLLVALYESFLFPLVRMLTVPMGLVGAFALLVLTGNTLNIFSVIGMIMAEGLVAKSGILLVDYTNTLRERGMGRLEALQTAARVRLRPIVMTSMTMIFGMLPLALKLEPGAESRAPMAVVVIGSLISSTVLTLVIVPALYTIFDDLQRRFSRAPSRAAERKVQPAPVPEPEPVLVAAGGGGEGSGTGARPGGAGRAGDGRAGDVRTGDGRPDRGGNGASNGGRRGWLQRLRGRQE
jgi:hydrophobic/amphiphilic exporter-1 (mainly G- bacteria), HAE1 family